MNGLILPKHIGVILDGNRRWASNHHMMKWQGHKYGGEIFDKFMEWCLEIGIPQVSAYVLSTENLDRSEKEVKELLKVLKRQLDKFETEKASLFDKYEVQIRFCGDMSRLPKDLVSVMKRIMKRTEKYNKKLFNILIAYGGRFELTHAFKKIMEGAMKSGRIVITQKKIEENLLVSGDVDLLIRTGGTHRLSNFLPWQSTYAEIYVTETLWPDFSKRELMKAIRWFSDTQRNFGK